MFLYEGVYISDVCLLAHPPGAVPVATLCVMAAATQFNPLSGGDDSEDSPYVVDLSMLVDVSLPAQWQLVPLKAAHRDRL